MYFTDYWKKGRCSEIPKKIRFLYFDTFVNGGGVAVLQMSAGVNVDSSLGKVTIEAAQRVTPDGYTNSHSNSHPGHG